MMMIDDDDDQTNQKWFVGGGGGDGVVCLFAVFQPVRPDYRKNVSSEADCAMKN